MDPIVINIICSSAIMATVIFCSGALGLGLAFFGYRRLESFRVELQQRHALESDHRFKLHTRLIESIGELRELFEHLSTRLESESDHQRAWSDTYGSQLDQLGSRLDLALNKFPGNIIDRAGDLPNSIVSRLDTIGKVVDGLQDRIGTTSANTDTVLKRSVTALSSSTAAIDAKLAAIQDVLAQAAAIPLPPNLIASSEATISPENPPSVLADGSSVMQADPTRVVGFDRLAELAAMLPAPSTEPDGDEDYTTIV
jgi:hypothetical protein